MCVQKAGLNYEVPEEGRSMFGGYQYVDENAVRLDLDDLGKQLDGNTYLVCHFSH